MLYQYQIIITTGQKPNLTEVNDLAQEGWELVQILQSTSEQMTGQWGYVMRKMATPSPQPAKEG